MTKKLLSTTGRVLKKGKFLARGNLFWTWGFPTAFSSIKGSWNIARPSYKLIRHVRHRYWVLWAYYNNYLGGRRNIERCSKALKASLNKIIKEDVTMKNNSHDTLSRNAWHENSGAYSGYFLLFAFLSTLNRCHFPSRPLLPIPPFTVSPIPWRYDSSNLVKLFRSSNARDRWVSNSTERWSSRPCTYWWSTNDFCGTYRADNNECNTARGVHQEDILKQERTFEVGI